MALRATMSNLIARVRLMINDPSGATQIFSDIDIQNVMDESSRTDINYLALRPYPTYTGSSMLFLDYYSDNYGDWEDDVVLSQYRTVILTPSASENIVGHWAFAATTLPPVYATGKSFDTYRSAADLLEQWAARWVLSFSFSSDGQSFRRSQAAHALQVLAKTYRMKQRPTMITATRSDLRGDTSGDVNLDPRPIDYYSDGQGR